MTRADFIDFHKVLSADAHEILFSKQKDYASEADALANFKNMGAQIGFTPMRAWALLFLKHIDAIMAFVRNGRVESEPIRSRFIDARNYLDLGLALVADCGNLKPEEPVSAAPVEIPFGQPTGARFSEWTGLPVDPIGAGWLYTQPDGSTMHVGRGERIRINLTTGFLEKEGS